MDAMLLCFSFVLVLVRLMIYSETCLQRPPLKWNVLPVIY